jgi:hypothetical protein
MSAIHKLPFSRERILALPELVFLPSEIRNLNVTDSCKKIMLSELFVSGIVCI